MKNEDVTSWYPFILEFYFFSKVLRNPPEQELLDSMAKEKFFSSWPIEPKSFDAKQSLAELINKCSKLTMERQNIAVEHVNLFSGPFPKIKPWESVWREKEKLLFGESTEQVKSFYLKWGAKMNTGQHEPEDHLGLELAFVVYLLEEFVRTSSIDTLKALTAFLEEHLLLWAPNCLEDTSKKSNHFFYKNIAVLCIDSINQLQEKLDSISK